MKPTYDCEKIKGILETAISNLFANQPNIFDFTSETGQTEWNLACHYANEVHKLLPDFDCDTDITKVNLNRKRPDIIFHSRGSHKNNFLVIEVKRNGSEPKVNSDIRKIKKYWFNNRLCYQFGAVINIKNDKTKDVKVFKNQKR